jgi:hypothetical protein
MGKLAAEGGDFVARFGEGLFLCEEGLAGFYPFLVCCFLWRMLDWGGEMRDQDALL